MSTIIMIHIAGTKNLTAASIDLAPFQQIAMLMTQMTATSAITPGDEIVWKKKPTGFANSVGPPAAANAGVAVVGSQSWPNAPISMPPTQARTVR